MAKRFTDSAKWGKLWFRKLPPKYKVLWDYLYTQCNKVGIWDVDTETASHFIDAKVNAEEALKLFKDQILPIDGGKKWYLTGFIQFQYGELTPNNNFHKALLASYQAVLPLIKEAQSSGAVEPLPVGLPSPIRIEREKDKDKEKGSAEGLRWKLGEYVWLTNNEVDALKQKMGNQNVQAFIERLNGYIGQIGEKKAAAKYKSHYHTILNWYRKDIDEGKIRPYTPPVKPVQRPVEKEPEYTEADQDEMHYAFVDNMHRGKCRVANCERCARRKKSKEVAGA